MRYLFYFSLALSAVVLAQAPPPNVPDMAVVAKVDGHPITAGEIRAALANMPPDFSRMFQQNPQVAVRQLYLMRHLADEGEKAKLAEQTPLKEQLALMRANALASAMVSQEHNKWAPSQPMMQDYYNANQAKFQQAKLKVITVQFKPASTGQTLGSAEEIARAAAEAATGKAQRTDAEAQKLAADLVQKIRAGADFVQLVKESSDDEKTKAASGDYGLVNSSSALPDNFKRAIFALKAGEITDPLRLAAAFYIFRVEEKSAQPLNDVSEDVIQEIKKQHINEWMQDLTKRFEPVIEDQTFFAPPPLPMSGPTVPSANGAAK